MSELTDLTVTTEDVQAAAADVAASETKIATGHNMAYKSYGELTPKYTRVADLIAKGVSDGLTTEQIADALTAGKLEQRKWQKSEVAHWTIAREIMNMTGLPNGVQLGRIPEMWRGTKGWVGDVPVFTEHGDLIFENGKVKTHKVKSMLTLARSACEYSGVTVVRSTIKAATSGQSAIEALESLMEEPKPSPSLTKILRSMRGASIRAMTPGLDVGDAAKNATLYAEIMSNLKSLGL
jgi:hypothetical protein